MYAFFQILWWSSWGIDWVDNPGMRDFVIKMGRLYFFFGIPWPKPE